MVWCALVYIIMIIIADFCDIVFIIIINIIDIIILRRISLKAI